jgi:putative peptide zinc metalloprotease protein
MSFDLASTLDQRMVDLDINQPKDDTLPGIWESIHERIQLANYQPKTDPDVIAKQLEDHHGVYYVLKNQREKTYLRLSATEYPLWTRMDGETSVQELIVDHFMSNGTFAHTLVAQLVEELYWHHMLSERPVAVWSQLKEAVQKRSWFYRLSVPAQWVLTQKLSIHGLDHYVEKLYQYFGWLFFTRPAQIFFLLMSIGGLIAYERLIRDPNYFFLGSNLISSLALLWLAAVLPVLIHELGHALTVKHYKREVPRGGLMLYFGMPAAFVETTDIWLEPRRARLAVTWNGPYTGLIVGGAAALFISLFPTAGINLFLFKMAGFAYLTVFLNVNPLLKFDGYYLLSDALEIPSLREKSLAFIRHKLLDQLIKRKKFTRDEVIYTIFGLLSVIWTAYAIYFVSFFWRTRLSTGLQTLLGRGYDLLTRLLSLLLVLAIASFSFLILLGLVRLGGRLISSFGKSRLREQHTRMALIGSGLALAIGFGLPLIFPKSGLGITAVIGAILSLAAAGQLSLFNRPYLGSPRGLAHGGIALSLFLIGGSNVARFLPTVPPEFAWLPWVALLLLILSNIFLVARPFVRLGPVRLMTGLLVGMAGGMYLSRFTSLGFSDYRLLILSMVPATGAWAVLGLTGSARAPAIGLLNFGGLLTGSGAIFIIPMSDLTIVGTFFMALGGLHIVYARLPQLTTPETETITSQTQSAIGSAVAILVRRLMAQVFFESGWNGARLVGREFSTAMRNAGVNLAIRGNQFHDQELPHRSATDLTEIYGLAFDELYHQIRKELGNQMGVMSFGYGIDQLPWQTREIVVELILSRRAWSLSLNQDVDDEKATRRKLLKRVPLFANCSDEELDRVAGQLRSETFAAGEVIIQQGDIGDKFYILQSGSASVWQTQSDGMDKGVDKKGPGQYFGELALVRDAPRNASVRADTPVILLSLNQKDFNQLVRQYVTLADQVDRDVRYSWLLRGMPIFDELEAHEMELLVAILEPETFKAGEIIFNEGDMGDKFYIIEYGQVSITHEVNDKSIELSRRGPGEYFGEIALLHKRARTATVTALQDSVLLGLKGEYFLNLISNFSQFGQAVSRTGSRRLDNVHRVDLKEQAYIQS